MVHWNKAICVVGIIYEQVLFGMRLPMIHDSFVEQQCAPTATLNSVCPAVPMQTSPSVKCDLQQI